MNLKKIFAKKAVKIGGAAVACLCVGTLLLASIGAPMQVETLTLEAGDAVVTYTGQGTVIYDTTLEIPSPLAGEVAEVAVAEGQAVRKGETIAVLSVPDVDYQIRRLEADIRGYQAQIAGLSLSEQKERDVLAGARNELAGQLTSLEAERSARENTESAREAKIRLQENMVDQDRANVSIARRELRSYRDDYGSDTSDPEYNALRTAVNNAEKALYASEQALLELQSPEVEDGYYQGREESLQAQIGSIDTQLGRHYSSGMQSYYTALIDSARLSIEELTQRQGKATIAAPYDCVVSSLEVKAGMLVEEGASVATVGSDPVVEILVPVREMDGIAPGDEVGLTLSKRAGDERVDGRVAHVAGQAQVQLSPLGVEESKVRVLVKAGSDIPVGSMADVEFTVYREENCLTVPTKAIFQLDGQDSVWVVRDGAAAVQPVTTGAQVRGGAVITEGLFQGDVVIADANLQGLADGKQVQAV